jgi:hypothetical protein
MSHEWFNDLLPHQNTGQSVQMVSLRVNATPTFVDLRTLFGNKPPQRPEQFSVPSGRPLTPTGGVFDRNLDPGHFYEIKADMAGVVPSGPSWRVYTHLSTTPSGITNREATTGSGVCWPLLDGQSIKGRIVGGVQQSPSGAFSPTSLSPSVLTYSVPTQAGTGWLRVRRSTLREGQHGGEFGVP